MKKMLLIPVLLLFVSSSLGQGKRPWHGETSGNVHVSYASEKMYMFEITPETLAKSPSWDRNTDNPPLPARKAIRAANVLKNKLVKDSKDYKWYLVSATLEQDWSESSDPGKWWWSINYEAHVRAGGETGGINRLDIIVLMDGTVVEPKISDYK